MRVCKRFQIFVHVDKKRPTTVYPKGNFSMSKHDKLSSTQTPSLHYHICSFLLWRSLLTKDKIMEILVGTLPLDQTAGCTSKQRVFKPTSIHRTKQLHTRQKGWYVFPTLMLNATSKKQMHLLHYLKKQTKAYRDRCRPACCNKCFCYKADRVLLHRSLLLTPAAKITPVRIKKSLYSKLQEPEQC
jgi:hypothetical protein